jgi:hypothetical protein
MVLTGNSGEPHSDTARDGGTSAASATSSTAAAFLSQCGGCDSVVSDIVPVTRPVKGIVPQGSSSTVEPAAAPGDDRVPVVAGGAMVLLPLPPPLPQRPDAPASAAANLSTPLQDVGNRSPRAVALSRPSAARPHVRVRKVAMARTIKVCKQIVEHLDMMYVTTTIVQYEGGVCDVFE